MVLPVSPYPVDTAAISIPDLNLKRFFGLSLCGIKEEQNYTAVVTSSSDPGDAASVDSPSTLKVVAKGYEPQ